MVGKVTLQRNNETEEGQNITLYDSGDSSVSFIAKFPECELPHDEFKFEYNGIEGRCSFRMWWEVESLGIYEIEKGKWKKISVNNPVPDRDILFKFIGDKVTLGNQPEQLVCAPRFKDGTLLFTVEDPGHCNATLDFQNNLPSTSTRTFEMVVSTTRATETGLSGTSLIFVIICSSVAGILLLLGLAALIYWFYRRRRAQKKVEMVRDPLDPKQYIAKSEKVRRMCEEKEALEDVIKRIRENKVLPWERKTRKNKPLTSKEIYDKEIAEAEWRWIHRRNRALQENEAHGWDKETEDQMKALEEAGREKELREFKTYISRPVLYKRYLDEKDVAQRRSNCRHNGITEPAYADRGCDFTKFERNITRQLPQPMAEDWLKESETKEKADVVGSEQKKSTPPTKKKSSSKKKSEQKSEHDDRPTPEDMV